MTTTVANPAAVSLTLPHLCRSDTAFVQEGRWWILRRDAFAAPPEFGHSDLGRPGLWKAVSDLNQSHRLFELHDSILRLGQDFAPPGGNDDDQRLVDACLAWARATVDGRIPDGWLPPPRAEIEALIPPGRLTLIAGAEARQGELIYAPARLALRFPVVSRVPDNLPELRRAWLLQTVAETQNHWRMVRVGLCRGVNNTAIIAEIDLTGVPHAAIEPLLSASLDSLHAAVGWLVETAVLLADATVACRALELGPSPQPHTKGTTP